MAAKAHNVKRTLHCAKDMLVDTTMAKALQKMLDASQTVTDPTKRPALYKDCIENFY